MTCFETVLLDFLAVGADVFGGLHRLSPGGVGTAGCPSELGSQSDVRETNADDLGWAALDDGGCAGE